MSPQQKREALSSVYPTPRWRAKVKKMSEDQVIAIYLRLKDQGKIK